MSLKVAINGFGRIGRLTLRHLLKENSDLFKEKKAIELFKLKKFYPMIPKNHFSYRLKIYLKIKMYE